MVESRSLRYINVPLVCILPGRSSAGLTMSDKMRETFSLRSDGGGDYGAIADVDDTESLVGNQQVNHHCIFYLLRQK